jgi:pimeloyl-ACP methyl ester carboxylesterase
MLANVTQRRIRLPDSSLEIALTDWGGSGPLALLHHANGFCGAMWAPVAEKLRPAYHVVAVDARGHGDSGKPEGAEAYAWPRFGEDVAAVGRALLAETGETRIALGLGHSFGGTSLLMASADAPELFDRLVLADPVMPPPIAASATDPERRNRGGRLAEKARQRRGVFESRDVARAIWSEKPMFQAWDPRAFELYLTCALEERHDGSVALKCRNEIEAAIFDNGADMDAWAIAARVTRPTLLLWAETGDFPRPVFEAVASRMPDARIVDAPTGHFVPMESPDFVVEQALAFAPPPLR